MKSETKTKKPTLRASLNLLEKEDLIEIILELSKFNPKNKNFIEISISGSDNINFDEIVKTAKSKIHTYIFGRGLTSRNVLKLREAKKVISDHAKLLKDYPEHIADLKLYYIETCHNFTEDFGDINEQFYDSIMNAFENFCDYILKHHRLYTMFKERIEKYYENSRGFGWGYSDGISDIYSEFIVKIDNVIS